MNPEKLNDFINDNKELLHHKDYLNSVNKPSVDISFSLDRPKDYESRFGGDPLVPIGFTWPNHQVGEYRFLGQINFSEINEIKGLPAEGLLSLFYASDEQGEVFWRDDGYVLGYYWPKIEELVLFNQLH